MATKSESSRSTGIPKIDAEITDILKLPKRQTKVITELDDDFPGCNIGMQQGREVFAVGAGWGFPMAATAIVAAGAKVIAYEMNPEKIGLGQIGSTRKEDYFQLQHAWSVAHLMPKFTSAQLERLPPVITKIAKDTKFEKLMKKVDEAQAIVDESGNDWLARSKKYNDLGNSKKISKYELIEVKVTILKLLQEAGALEFVHQEVTIELMQSWLEANKPVLMASGEQVNLKPMGLDHLGEVPGFVKEFRLESTETENAIAMIAGKQENPKDNGDPPKVAFIGGGPSAAGCALDLSERVKIQELEVVWISPEGKEFHVPDSLREAQKRMKYEWFPCYISDVALSEDERTIESVKIVNPHGGQAQDIQCDLLIHTWNHQIDDFGTQKAIMTKARDSITALMDEKKPSNGLVRDGTIFRRDDWQDIVFRITEPWVVSLQDDELLKKEIQKLIDRQDREEVTMVVNGKSLMANCVILLAASLGYHGHCIAVSLPFRESWELELHEKLEKVKQACTWHDVKGRLVKDGSAFQNGKFSLGVRNKKGEEVKGVPDVDVVINAAGKTRKTPLVQDMMEKGYIGQSQSSIYSDHPTLFGIVGFFGTKKEQSDVEGPDATIYPASEEPSRVSRPRGWEAIFNSARSLTGHEF